METSRRGKSAYFSTGVFLRDNGDISMTAAYVNGFHPAVSNRPGGKRPYPDLYRKLARALEAGGAPHPRIEAGDATDPDG